MKQKSFGRRVQRKYRDNYGTPGTMFPRHRTCWLVSRFNRQDGGFPGGESAPRGKPRSFHRHLVGGFWSELVTDLYFLQAVGYRMKTSPVTRVVLRLFRGLTP